MTLLKLSNNQLDTLRDKTKNLCRGDLLLKLFSDLYLEERPELITKEFNTRNAMQIIDSGYATGCTDFAIVLCTFLKNLEIPYTYVEVLEKRWLDAPMEEKKVMGHAFVRVENLLVDPQRKIIYHDTKFILSRYEIFGEGSEPYDLGLVNFQTNMQKYFDFKEQHKSKNKDTNTEQK